MTIRWLVSLSALCLSLALLSVGCDNGTAPAATAAAPANANVAGAWNGTSGSGLAYNFGLSQAGDAITGSFSNDSGGAGTVTGSVSDGDHAVMQLNFTAGATPGYFETWDGHVNSTVNEMLGTRTPGNGRSEEHTSEL